MSTAALNAVDKFRVTATWAPEADIDPETSVFGYLFLARVFAGQYVQP